MKRFPLFADIPENDWNDWKWQLRNRLDNNSDIKRFFPDLPKKEVEVFHRYIDRYNIAVTPYTLSLVELDALGNPVENDPIWNQFRFYCESEMTGFSDYDGLNENWEEPGEMPTPILHHKYPGRAIIRVINTCFGHCNYCYLTARVIDRTRSPQKIEKAKEWEASLQYLKDNPSITDILLSGGDPLMLSNSRLDSILSQLRQIPSVETIRMNTRVLTFNPFRLDGELVSLLSRHAVTALEVHISHPAEITDQFDRQLALLDSGNKRPLILWRAPLLRTINDSKEILKDLFLKLYKRRIRPYYLFHYAPFTLGRSTYGLSVKTGSKLLGSIRREIPGPAFPRYTLFHIGGKHDIPLEPGGTPEFIYATDEKGKPVIHFKNWMNEWVTYPDIEDN